MIWALLIVACLAAGLAVLTSLENPSDGVRGVGGDGTGKGWGE